MDHWFVTRPKRKLILIPDLIKIFAATAEGKRWTGNRQLQLKFEKAITNAGWKAQNISDDGSGGRTYAALLYMLGLWYETETVQITTAANEIIDGISSPVAVLTKQLLDFQYPSPYSLKRNVNISREFQIQPYRFILNILLVPEIIEITQEEIAFCLVPFAKKMQDLELCTNLILEYRKNKDKVTKEALHVSGRNEAYLKNLGNTIVNQLEYTGYFEENPDIKSLKFRKDKLQDAKSFLTERRKSLIQNPDNAAQFQRRYGCGLEITKDYKTSVRKPMLISPNERKVIENFYILAAQKPVVSIDDDLIHTISSDIGASTHLVRETLNKLPLNTTGNEFEDTYLRLAAGGRATATDFERKTATLFNEGFDLNSLWVGNLPLYPDIIVFLDGASYTHGILDTKAYTDYSLPNNHRNVMAVNYIEDFRTYSYQNKDYRLSFFGYIAGNYGTNIQKSFEKLLAMTDIPGSYITARDLLHLYHIHKEDGFTPLEICKIFSCNKQINPNESRSQ